MYLYCGGKAVSLSRLIHRCQMFCLRNDERLISNVRRHHLPGIFHLTVKEVNLKKQTIQAGQDKWD